jgi:TPR repeat protein
MRFGGPIAILLVFCLMFSAVAQDSTSLDALFRQAAEREPRDLAGATRLYEQAARQGHVPSMVRLGYLRQSGGGGPQDSPEAFSLYSQAAKAGDADGKFFQAMSYAQGVGTRKDSVTARNLLLQPATDGHQASQYALGIMLALGEGGPKKEAAARRWLDKASTGPDRELATRAAALRDKIDKNIFAPDNSGVAILGLAGFILVAGMLAGGDGYDAGGTSAGGVSGPAGSSASRPAPRPAHCYPVPVIGVARTGVIYNQGVGTTMRCD